MTTFLLIRHAAHDLLGKRIAGRMPGVGLNPAGRAQAEQVVERVAAMGVEAVYSGPLERVRESAEPICQRLGLPLQIAEEFNEVDFGDWTNASFEELDGQPGWERFNSFRSQTAPPHGELMLEVQTRVVRKLHRLCGEHRCVAVVSHGDVIRAALAHFLGIPLDLFQRLEISPASISVVELDGSSVRVLSMNVAL